MNDDQPPAIPLAAAFTTANDPVVGSPAPFTPWQTELLGALISGVNEQLRNARWTLRAIPEGYYLMEAGTDSGIVLMRMKQADSGTEVFRIATDDRGINLNSIGDFLSRLQNFFETHQKMGASRGVYTDRPLN